MTATLARLFSRPSSRELAVREAEAARALAVEEIWMDGHNAGLGSQPGPGMVHAMRAAFQAGRRFQAEHPSAVPS